MDFARQLKTQVDIVKTISEYGVRLKKMGNRYLGLCPFHTEKTPSFNVNGEAGFYKCFGCDAKGDVFTFIENIEGLTFLEAMKLLAERNGVPLPNRSEYTSSETRARDALMAMNEIAAETFRKNLFSQTGSDARSYLGKRGLTQSAAEEFALGVSDRSGQQLAQLFAKQFSPEQLEASGLVNKRQDGSGFFDRFRGRLMFPIHDEFGKVIGFGGRALYEGDEPKYLNSPETAVYKKSFVLYNLHRAKKPIRKSEQSILVEGYMDVIGVYVAGIHNVVASCGTALTSAQVKAMKRHAENIVVNFDPDNAGATAAERSVQLLLDEGMKVHILELDQDLDPDEYIKVNGADIYASRLARAPGYFIWLADRARKKFDMNTSEGKMQGMDFLLPSIRKISDRLERATVANEVAAYLGIDRGLVLDEFRKAAVDRKPAAAKPKQTAVPRNERILLRSLLMNADVREILMPHLQVALETREFATAGILKKIFHMHEAQPNFTYHDLEGRLEERETHLMNEAFFADSTGESFTPEQARAYVAVLESEHKQARIATLRSQLKEAERSGNVEAAFRLMEQINSLQRGAV